MSASLEGGVDPAILSLFETLTGPHKVPYGDPFWNQLLAEPRLPEAFRSDAACENPVLTHFAERMLSSNLRSGNLSVLIHQTVHCLSLALGAAEGRGEGGQDFFMLEALNGVRLTSGFVGHLLAKAPTADTVLEHLQPFFYDTGEAPTRPVAQAPTEAQPVLDADVGGGGIGGRSVRRRPSAMKTGAALIPTLLDALVSWIMSDAWDATAKLPVVDLLLVLLSSQMYQGLGGGGQVMAAAGRMMQAPANVFLEALMKEAIDQNDRAAVNGNDTSGALGFKLVRLLLMWFMERPGSKHQRTESKLSAMTPRWLGGKREESFSEAVVESPQSGQGGILSLVTLPFRTIYSLLFQPAAPAADMPSKVAAPPSPVRTTSSLSLPAAATGSQDNNAATSSTGFFGRGIKGTGRSPLAERGTMLLLLLVHNCRSRGDLNPFRDAFCSVVDERYHDLVDDGEMLGHQSHSLKMPLDKLFAGFAANLHSEEAALLFYSLLTGNPLFLDTTLSRVDVEVLFMPLLQQLYHTDRIRSSRQLYVLVIILLILTQDASFNVGIFRRLMLPTVPWYKERQLTNISLGSLVMLCVLRVMVHNLNRARDTYLLSNCSAILLNLAPQAERIHEYTALRLSSVLATIMRRYVRLATREEGVHTSPHIAISPAGPVHISSPPVRPLPLAGGHPSPSRSIDSASTYGGVSGSVINAVLDNSTATRSPAPSVVVDDSSYMDQLSEAMRVLLTVLNICLRPSLLQTNVRLVHYLLYSQRELEPYLHHPKIVELGYLGALPSVIEHFSQLFDAQEETLSVDQAMKLLDKGARQLANQQRGQIETETDLKFTYEEEVDPEYFFVPYIWEIVYRTTKDEIHWVSDNIAIFDPHAAEASARGDRSPTRGSSVGYRGRADSIESSAKMDLSHTGSSISGSGEPHEHSDAPKAPPPVVLTMHV